MPTAPQELIDKYSYTAQEIDFIFNEIIRPGYADRKVPVSNGLKPVAYILGGQPGAGKSELIDIIKVQLDMNVVECNADNFREQHPRIDEIVKESADYYPDLTADFIKDINGKLVAHCLKRKLNFILETTFSSGATTMNRTIKRFKKQGYIVNIAIMSVNPKLSYLNTMTRYEKMLGDPEQIARKVGVERHDGRWPMVPTTLRSVVKRKLYDDIYIYGRAGLSTNKGKTNGLVLKQKNGLAIVDAYIQEREKQWTEEDKQYFMQRALLLAERMVKRSASMDELRELFHYYNFSDYTQDSSA